MRVAVCVTGASGAIYARRILGLLSAAVREGAPWDVHWVASANAAKVWRSELGESMPKEVPGLRRWNRHDFNAPFASGSSPADAVIAMPCSMSTVARVAHGGGDDLIARACEVALKERQRLILVARETPLSLVHLRNMVAATEAGAIILPAVPSFYAGINDLEGAVDTVIARVLDRAGLDRAHLAELHPRWGGEGSPSVDAGDPQ